MDAVELTPGYDFPDEIRGLLSEYTGMLVRLDPDFQLYLNIQHYEDEVRDLTVKYGLPDGRLYLARVGGKAAGCIALRKLDEERCEMKRLYVRPAFRGTTHRKASGGPDHRRRPGHRLPPHTAGHTALSGGRRPHVPEAGLPRYSLLQRQSHGYHTFYGTGPMTQPEIL